METRCGLPDAYAGGEGKLRPAIAWTLLGLTFSGLLLALLLGARNHLVDHVYVGKTPDVLRERAQQVIRAMRDDEAPLDSASGFMADDLAIRHVRGSDRSSSWPERLVIGRPPALLFWYRQSSRHLVPRGERSVEVDEPPLREPGELRVVLDTRGHLVEFVATPHEVERAERSPTGPDWSALFAEADLEQRGFVPTAPMWMPPVHADTRMAWEGSYRGGDPPVRVEAAARSGEPVFFRVIGSWSTPAFESPHSKQESSLSEGAAGGRPSTLVRARQVVSGSVFVAALVGAGFLARQNLRSARGDRVGALKVALAYLTGNVVAWLVQADHVPGLWEEIAKFQESTGASLFSAMMLWLLYIALEPFARRHWPTTLISWNRLLAGRLRDPLVGRDVLIGCLLGGVFFILRMLGGLSPSWLGWPPALPTIAGVDHLGELRWHLGRVIEVPLSAIWSAMQALFILVLLRFVLRREWLAGAAMVIIYTALVGLQADYLLVTVIFNGIMVALWVVAVLRLGFLPAACGVFVVFLLGGAGLTIHSTAWYATGSLVALVALATVASYGFHTALAHRPMFGGIGVEQ